MITENLDKLIEAAQSHAGKSRQIKRRATEVQTASSLASFTGQAVDETATAAAMAYIDQAVAALDQSRIELQSILDATEPITGENE